MSNRFYYNNEERHNKISSSSGGRIHEIFPQNNISNNNNKSNKKKVIIILIPVFILILVAVIVSSILIVKTKNKKGSGEEPQIENSSDNIPSNNNPSNNNPKDDTQETENIYIIIDNPKFKKIKVNQITNDSLLIENINQTFSSKRENIYDISAFIEYPSGEENKIKYTKKINYLMLIQQRCLTIENENEYCDIFESDSNNLNLRNLDNNQEKIPLLCYFNLTDNNIILSIKCSKSFPMKLKSEIISDLNCFKNYLNNEGLIQLPSFSKEKKISNNNNGYIMKNEVSLEINSIDKEMDIENLKKINLDDSEKIINSEEEDEEEVEEDEEVEVEVEENQNENNNNNEVVLFEYKILDFTISLLHKIEYKDYILKAFFILKINNEKKYIPYMSKKLELDGINDIKSDIENIKEKGKNLTQDIKYNLESLYDIISQNISLLNENINENKLEEISEIKNKKESNEEFLNESNNVKNDLSDYLNKIGEDMKSFIEEINANISIYAEESHKLIKKVSEKMKHLKNVLNSSENIYSKIAIYYLNDTPTSYNDIIEKAKNIFNKNEKESINKEIELLSNKFENGLSINNEINKLYNYKNYLKESNIIDDNIKELNNIISYIISKIKEEIENKKNILDNGYFNINNNNDTYNEAIKELLNNDTYNETINELLNVTSKFDNLEVIDKLYDELMINFKENFTNLLQYLQNEGNDKFLLENNVLTENNITQEEKQIIENLTNVLINDINNNNNLYLNNIKKEVENITNRKDEINSFIFDLSCLCSNESLKELSLSFKNSFTNFLNSIKNYIQRAIDSYYLLCSNDTYIFKKLNIDEKDDKIISKKISKEKYNDIKDAVEYIYNKTIISVLNKEFNNIYYKIKKIMYINNYNITNDELSFINHNKNILEILNERIYLYFSNTTFQDKYEKELNDLSFINNDTMKKYDFLQSFQKTSKCSNNYIYIKLKSGRVFCIDIFDESDEIINFNFGDIFSDNNFMIFKNQLENFYLSLNHSINIYYSKISSSLSSLEELINKYDININLNPIVNIINSLLSEKLGTSLLNNCYNYYKSKTYDNIDAILNGFLNLINNTFDDCADQLTNNLNKFKKSMDEFGYLTLIYQNIITQNITRNFFDTLIDNQKNNFNYTISYYYLLFINLVKSTKNNIINQLPINKNDKQFENIKITILIFILLMK